MKRKSLKELTDNGVPYFVSPDDLRALQIDPDLYFKTGSNGHDSWAGWMLDRKEDAALIGQSPNHQLGPEVGCRLRVTALRRLLPSFFIRRIATSQTEFSVSPAAAVRES